MHKRIDFKIEITTNSKKVIFLDVIYKVETNTHQTYRKIMITYI